MISQTHPESASSAPVKSMPDNQESEFSETPSSDNQHRSSGLLMTDPRFLIHSCNDVFLAMSGCTREEIVGNSFLDFLDSHDQHNFQHLLATGSLSSDHSGSILLQNKQGISLSYLYTIYTVPAGSIDMSIIIALHDLSVENRLRSSLATTRQTLSKTVIEHDRKMHEYTASLIDTNVDLRKKIREHRIAAEALKASESRFRDLTETTSDFIWEIDRNGRYVYVSPKITKLLGYSPEELLGEPFLLIRNPEMAARFIREIELGPLPESGFSSWQFSYFHKDGREIFIESSGEPIILKKNEISGYRGIDRDVTDRIYYEKNLRIAKEQAESANRAKSEFLANMSHELRTPLHAILSFSKFGEKKTTGPDHHELHKYFQQIETSAHRLLPLINSLLDLSKLEAGKMSYDIIHGSIRDEILIALDEIAPLAAQKNVQLVFDKQLSDTTVYFDKQKIGQVVRNLLSNSIKFCHENTSIVISFSILSGPNNKDHLRTTIADTGIGIPENETETIFDKFAQSSKTKTGAGGTGLGLAICRQILSDLRGRVWAENGSDGQTFFHFSLPTYPKSGRLGQILIERGLVTREDLEKALLDQK